MNIVPIVNQTAHELGLPLIDVYIPLTNHPEYFSDGVHLNAQGLKNCGGLNIPCNHLTHNIMSLVATMFAPSLKFQSFKTEFETAKEKEKHSLRDKIFPKHVANCV